MKKYFKQFFSLLIALTLFVGLGVSAMAADSEVIYKGRKNGFEFGSGSVYTETDLFENYKNVMPGDTLSETVTVKNEYKGCDYIKVWMGGLLHDQTGNPISQKVLEELSADDRKETMSELEYMHDFLKQLTLTVWKGDKKDANIIYQGNPNSLETGFEDGSVYLGKLKRGESITLNVELAVPLEMGNEYADRIGEVDWVFVIEERNNPSNQDPEPEKPDESEYYPAPDRPGVSTGDNSDAALYILLIAVAVIGFVIVWKQKKKRN